MITVRCRALLFLQPKLAARGIGYRGTVMELAEGTTVADLIAACGLEAHEAEAAFVDHKVAPPEYELRDGEEVVLLPPGTPGPHRYLLGIAKLPEQ